MAAIEIRDRTFLLNTRHTSYLFTVNAYGHVEHLHYGKRVRIDDAEALRYKRTIAYGSLLVYPDLRSEDAANREGTADDAEKAPPGAPVSAGAPGTSDGPIAHRETVSSDNTSPGYPSSAYLDRIDRRSDQAYSLDNIPLEWSGSGRGDFRVSPLHVEFSDGTFITDFLFDRFEVREGVLPAEMLPTAYDDASESEPGENKTTESAPGKDVELESDRPSQVETLVLVLKEAALPLELRLIYTVFPEEDVISRRVVLRNLGASTVNLHKVMSQMVDLPERAYDILTVGGDWNAEANAILTPLTYGRFVNESRTGSSSNRHNPGLLLADHRATEDFGDVYGFNLVYSGDHQTSVERSSRGLVRVMSGIQPENFNWQLLPGEFFETPEAILTYSDQGFNGASFQFHRFIARHIVRKPWRDRERPVVINSWEAYMFDFNEAKLLSLARRAKALGIELFVLDDGWFGERDDDRAGLGDYEVNRKKLPSGLSGFSEKVEAAGMRFGLWFEPEAVNPQSALYRAHPEYAIQAPDRVPLQGRHELLLDLSNPEVQDYIVEQVTTILDSASIAYVKWDMNRHMSDFYSNHVPAGAFTHRYIIGLYQVLKRIFGPRPEILLEMCSSGGNRFDLGMLCFAAQIWASDNTDPIERLRIQKGLSYFYPQSAMGAHVSAAPHTQTLRDTPLSTRFNVAAFGAFGYELDLSMLNAVERQEVRAQIAFYKKYRALFQFGRFYRYNWPRPNQEAFSVVSEDRQLAIAMFATTLTKSGEPNDRLRVAGLDANTVYRVRAYPQKVFIDRFGHLINYVSPIRLHPDSFLVKCVNRHYAMDDGALEMTASGAALESGVGLNNQFIGTGYEPGLRMWGDFGSTLYVIQAVGGGEEVYGKQS